MSKPDKPKIIDLILIRQVLNGKSADVLRAFLKIGDRLFYTSISKEFLLRLLREIEEEEKGLGESKSSQPIFSNSDSKDDSRFSLPEPIRDKLRTVSEVFSKEETTGFFQGTEKKTQTKVKQQELLLKKYKDRDEEEEKEIKKEIKEEIKEEATPKYKSTKSPGDSEQIRKYLETESVLAYHSYGNSSKSEAIIEGLEDYFTAIHENQEREFALEKEKEKPVEPSSSSSSASAPIPQKPENNKTKYRVRQQVIIETNGGILFEGKGGSKKMEEEHPIFRDEVKEEEEKEKQMESLTSKIKKLKEEGGYEEFLEPIMLDLAGNVDPKIYISQPIAKEGGKYKKSVTIVIPENQRRIFSVPNDFENVANIHVIGSGLKGTRKLKRRIKVNLITGEVELEKQIYVQNNGVILPIGFNKLTEAEKQLIQNTEISLVVKRISVPQKQIIKDDPIRDEELLTIAHLQNFHDRSESIRGGKDNMTTTIRTETILHSEENYHKGQEERKSMIASLEAAILADARRIMYDKSLFGDVLSLENLKDHDKYLRLLAQVTSIADITKTLQKQIVKKEDQKLNEKVKNQQIEKYEQILTRAFEERLEIEKHERKAAAKIGELILTNLDEGSKDNFVKTLNEYIDKIHTQDLTKAVECEDNTESESRQKVQKFTKSAIDALEKVQFVPEESDQGINKDAALDLIGKLARVMFLSLSKDDKKSSVSSSPFTTPTKSSISSSSFITPPAISPSSPTPKSPAKLVQKLIEENKEEVKDKIPESKDAKLSEKPMVKSEDKQEPPTRERAARELQDRINNDPQHQERLNQALQDLNNELQGKGDWKRALIIRYLEAEYVQKYLLNVHKVIEENKDGPSSLLSPSRRGSVSRALIVNNNKISEYISKRRTLTYGILSPETIIDPKTAKPPAFKDQELLSETAELNKLLKMSYYQIIDGIVSKEVEVLTLLDAVKTSTADEATRGSKADVLSKAVRTNIREPIGKRVGVDLIMTHVNQNDQIPISDLLSISVSGSSLLTVAKPSATPFPIGATLPASSQTNFAK